LLETFITGDPDFVPKPLLQLMTVMRIDAKPKVRWIPYHMMEVLDSFAKQAVLKNHWALNAIPQEFAQFVKAKDQSGDGWESLFVVVLLIRALSAKFDTKVLSLDAATFTGCSVSLNTPFLLPVGKTFGEISDVEEFVEGIGQPAHHPHIAVYFPTHAQFELYDVIVAISHSGVHMEKFGYQLKERKKLPKKAASNVLDKSLVIRGQPTAESINVRKWTVVGEAELCEFLGESGRHWTPMHWSHLNSSTQS
jgi:hypothetical protein